MFTVYHSNQLDTLIKLMADLISDQTISDPFQPEVILVQDTSMVQWIHMQLAVHCGIAANIEFLLLADFIRQMCKCFLPNIPDKSSFTKPAMIWRLMMLLPHLCCQPNFTVIHAYLHDQDDVRKLFQFASHVANLFDQYLVYRPDWLAIWQRGELIDGLGEAQQWQAPLWRALVAETKQTSDALLWYDANLYQILIKTLLKIQKRPSGIPDRVFICGVSTLPPIYLQVLQSLSCYVNIYLLFINPYRYYWGGLQDHSFIVHSLHHLRRYYQNQVEHAFFCQTEEEWGRLFNEPGSQKRQDSSLLLSSWGKRGGDNLYLLAQIKPLTEIDIFVNPVGSNLLSLLQRDILMLEDHSIINMDSIKIQQNINKKRLLRKDDNSLSIHACHSVYREVEVLHDSLLAMMAEDATLQFRDIIIMVTDIDRYTPAIQAIFSNISGGRNNLPFTISGRQMCYFHPVISAFLSLLELPHSRFISEEVMALLEVPALAARFNINEQELPLLRQWVSESGIRWGLNDDSLSKLMLPTTGQHTWWFGLTRMLLGYAMDSESGDWKNIFPYNVSSGLAASLVGKLAEVLIQLNHWREWLSKSRSLNMWLSAAHEIIKDFFISDTDDKVSLALGMLEDEWKRIIESGLCVGYSQPIPIKLLHNKLTNHLNHMRISQHFLSETINFCSFGAMRSIPFRVVCLLGMNDGVYPRIQPKTSCDLMAQHPRCGDCNLSDDDRYLFLEAVLSARQRLYISFIGRDIQNNALYYPSGLVSELSNYVSHNFYLLNDKLVNAENNADHVCSYIWQWHSSTPFAAENFLPDSKNQSFAKEWLPVICATGKPRSDFAVPLIELQRKTLTLDELLRFYRHPVRAWFVQRLAVSFYQSPIELAADETFTVNNLTHSWIKNRLASALIDGKSTDQLFRQLCADGFLPYGAFGQLYWVRQCQKMSVFAERVKKHLLPETRSFDVDLMLGNIRFSGWLSQVQMDGLLRWRAGTLSARDGLLLWLEHLSYCAMGGVGESRMLGLCGDWHFAPLPAVQAKVFLSSLIYGYFQGMATPLLLLPYSGGVWLSHCYDRFSQEINRDDSRQLLARNKLIHAWYGNQHVIGEGKDPYLQRLMRQLNKKDIERIILLAEQYLLPIFTRNLALTN